MSRSLKQNRSDSSDQDRRSFSSITILREHGDILNRLEGFVSAIATGTNIIVTVEKRSQLTSIPTQIEGFPIEARVGERILASAGICPPAPQPHKRSR